VFEDIESPFRGLQVSRRRAAKHACPLRIDDSSRTTGILLPIQIVNLHFMQSLRDSYTGLSARKDAGNPLGPVPSGGESLAKINCLLDGGPGREEAERPKTEL
jgi:hypothetical protein